ncbi:site-2 protease family protein [Patescibacteria group bacterium]|nr:site-2 protease family protein [Patescibacteria group bacterium]
MFFTIFIALASLIGLMIIHELGHFVIAKKFGVKVEEFGIGYPPRLLGKKIGGTLYSLNLLPFGAFVKIYGEEKEIDDYSSFSGKPVWQRILIVLGGVISFWIVAAVLLTIVMGLGAPTAVSDEDSSDLKEPSVQIIAVASNSPAEISDLAAGDVIKRLTIDSQQLTINKVKEVQEFTEAHKGEEIVLTIQRGKEVFDVSLVPRLSPPEGEGAIGVGLVRVAIKNYPWYQAPIQGVLETLGLTKSIVMGLAGVMGNVAGGAGFPPGVQLMGPVGVFGLFTQMAQLGIIYFLRFVAAISVYLAIFNILPIPALDGGKLAFLILEGIRRKPIDQKIEQGIHFTFFVLLIFLMIFVTIKFDIPRIF